MAYNPYNLSTVIKSASLGDVVFLHLPVPVAWLSVGVPWLRGGSLQPTQVWLGHEVSELSKSKKEETTVTTTQTTKTTTIYKEQEQATMISIDKYN